MAGVLFWFENFDKDVFSSRHPVDLDAWRYALKAGGINTAACINESSVFSNEQLNLGAEFNFSFYDTFEDWEANHLNRNILMFEPIWDTINGSTPFDTINHSTIDWYVFGPARGLPKDRSYTYTHIRQNGKAALHPVHIASHVMFSRYAQLET